MPQPEGSTHRGQDGGCSTRPFLFPKHLHLRGNWSGCAQKVSESEDGGQYLPSKLLSEGEIASHAQVCAQKQGE